jgi:ketosteroid isomerase-like protein
MTATDDRSLSPKEVVIKFLGLMRSATPEDTEKAGMMFAEDASFWILGNLPMSGELRGREEIMVKRFRRGHGRTVQGSKSLDIGKVIAEGEFVAAEWVSRRKVIDGADYVNTFFGLFQVKDGKIVSLREYMDTLAVKEAGWDRTAIPTSAPMPVKV